MGTVHWIEIQIQCSMQTNCFKKTFNPKKTTFKPQIRAVVAARDPSIWTSTYGLEPVLCNRLIIEPSGWAQTIHMFTQRFT